MEKVLDIERILRRAEREYLVEGKCDFRYPIKCGARWTELESQLRKNTFLTVTAYRDVREGKIKVGRPSEVGFSTQALLAKCPEISNVKRAWDQAAKELLGFVDWESFIKKNFSECRKKADLLVPAAKVIRYLVEHRDEVKGLYPRQIPHGQSTKLIGYEPFLLRLYAAYRRKREVMWDDFYGEFGLKRRPIGFQFSADQITWDNISLRDVRAIVDEENVGRWGFSSINRILIVENEESFFPLQSQVPGTLLINGCGKKAAKLGFLREYLQANVSIYYWGDIDKEGYEILSQVAVLFSNVKPLCMDQEAISRYWDLRQEREKIDVEEYIVALLDNEYRMVCRQGIQIEQEQIALRDVIESIAPLAHGVETDDPASSFGIAGSTNFCPAPGLG